MDDLKDRVLSAARGNWRQILLSVGFPDSSLTGRGVPCPKCGGTDRFSFTDRDGSGSVYCRKCNPAGPTTADGLGATQWLLDIPFPAAIKRVAEIVGIEVENAERVHESMLVRVARLKRCHPDFLQRYGCTDARRYDGEGDSGREYDVIRFPMYSIVDGKLKATSSFDLGTGTDRLRKGKNATRGTPGFFIPVGPKGALWRPNPERPVSLVEGVKDAAKLLELNRTAIGLPTTRIPKDQFELFRGLDVFLVPDRDTAGDAGAQHNAAMLWGIARSIRIVRLPSPIVAKGGDGVREIASRMDGARLIEEAYANATEWRPKTIDTNAVLQFSDAARLWFTDRSSRTLRTWSTGVEEIDSSITGLNENEFVVLAGLPGRGKTAFALHLALSIVLDGGASLVCSQEMQVEDIAERVLQNILGKSRKALRDMVSFDPEKFENTLPDIQAYDNLLIAPRRKNIDEILATIDTAVSDYGVNASFIDYAQIIEGVGRDDREKLNYITQRVADFCKTRGTIICLLSQLNRDAETSGKRPSLSNLKGSGSLAQDADSVIAVDYKFDASADEDNGQGNFHLYMLKNRYNGIRRSHVQCEFLPEIMRFASPVKNMMARDFGFNL